MTIDLEKLRRRVEDNDIFGSADMSAVLRQMEILRSRVVAVDEAKRRALRGVIAACVNGWCGDDTLCTQCSVAHAALESAVPEDTKEQS